MKKGLNTILLLFLAHVVYGDDKLSGKLNIVVNFSDISALPTHLYIHNTGLDHNSNTADTIKITKEQFTYSTLLAEPSRIKISLAWPDKRVRSSTFWAFPGTYDLKTQNMVPLITGGNKESAQKLIALESAVWSFQLRGDSLVKKVDYRTQSNEEAGKQVRRIRDSLELSVEEMVFKKHVLDRDGVVSLYTLLKYAKRVQYRSPFKAHRDSVQALLNSLDPGLRKLPSALMLQKQLNHAIGLLPGNMLKNIELRDTSDNTVRISDYKGMYLLVEFWASWCAPCREEAPALIQLYQKYKDANFRIISITRDESTMKRAWRNAIEKDKIGIWPQLSDFDKKAKNLYGIDFVPANFLLDPEGQIIGKNLRGTELSLTLSRLFEP